ncbi:MAG: hypothetical protein LBH67_00975 [Rickettsia sp.]|jgi:hypothetical protein|nr:hypothetical protein [Rickettsia sp.]
MCEFLKYIVTPAVPNPSYNYSVDLSYFINPDVVNPNDTYQDINLAGAESAVID